jgi:hypothetical protein
MSREPADSNGCATGWFMESSLFLSDLLTGHEPQSGQVAGLALRGHALAARAIPPARFMESDVTGPAWFLRWLRSSGPDNFTGGVASTVGMVRLVQARVS